VYIIKLWLEQSNIKEQYWPIRASGYLLLVAAAGAAAGAAGAE
jgi:hypothetical protein